MHINSWQECVFPQMSFFFFFFFLPFKQIVHTLHLHCPLLSGNYNGKAASRGRKSNVQDKIQSCFAFKNFVPKGKVPHLFCIHICLHEPLPTYSNIYCMLSCVRQYLTLCWLYVKKTHIMQACLQAKYRAARRNSVIQANLLISSQLYLFLSVCLIRTPPTIKTQRTTPSIFSLH